MGSILRVRERRGGRARPVIYDKPEKSTLSGWQFSIAIIILAVTVALAYRFLLAK